MNLRSKWCVYGLLSWAAMAGIAGAQQAPGSVRLGAPSAEQLPPPITSLNDGTGQMNLGGGGMGYTTVQRQFRPRVNIDTHGGGLYGYSPGYTNLGMFLPYDTGVDSQMTTRPRPSTSDGHLHAARWASMPMSMLMPIRWRHRRGLLLQVLWLVRSTRQHSVKQK